MRECVRELCVVSIFCGAVLSLCPEGGAKKILRILETAALLAVILNSVGKLDLETYSLQLARIHEMEEKLESDSIQLKSRLDRLVIEDEYVSYLEKRAEAAGINPIEIRILARWNKEGLWMPDSARIHLSSENGRYELAQILVGDLGIPAERQEWIIDE